MGNCVSLIKRKKEPSKAITLAIIGLDNAGKTTLCSVFAGESPDPDIAPTVGFRSVKFSMANFDITMFDLGGGKNIRPIWKNYYSELYGVLYVVDSNSATRLKEARDLFRDSLEHPLVSGKPVLVVANKVDVDGHMEEVDIMNHLDVERTANATNCPSHFVMVSALKGSGKKMDKELQAGLKWLLGNVRSSFTSLDPRVEEDVRNMKEVRDKEKEERRERVRKQREERERVQNLDREHTGLGKRRDSDDEDIIGGDPFKRLDYDKLKKKEDVMKDERKWKKDKLKDVGDGDKIRMPRSKDDFGLAYGRNSSLETRHSPQPFSRFGHDAGMDEVDSDMPRFGRSTRPLALPPLEPMVSQSMDSKLAALDSKKKGKKKKKLMDYHMNDDDNLSDRKDRDDAIGRLGLSLHEPGSWNRPEADVYDLTPRVSKPKKTNKVTRSGKIDEIDSEGKNDMYSGVSLKEYGNARMTEKLNKYGEMYPLKSSYARDDMQRNGDIDTNSRWRMEREDSMYRKSLKDIAPPNLKRFDDYDDEEEDEKNIDEGIGDNSDNISDDDLDKYRMSKYRNTSKHVTGSSYGRDDRRKAKKRLDSDEDDDELEYSVHSTLKDTMKFPRSPPEGQSNKDFRKELDDLRYRKANDYYSRQENDEYGHSGRDSHHSSKRDRYDDEDEEEDDNQYSRHYSSKDRTSRHDDYYGRKNHSPVDDDEDDRRHKSSSRPDQQRKKKKNIFRSNRLMPSDDDETELATPKRFGAPRLVQEHGSRNTSDNDTPSKGRNSRSTHFHTSSRESDFENKWGLAEDLPAIDNDYGSRRLRRPNMDSDGEDVMF